MSAANGLFSDGDFTPKHDAIMIWLDARVDELWNRELRIPELPSWGSFLHDVDRARERFDSGPESHKADVRICQSIAEFEGRVCETKVLGKIWEQPIVDDRGVCLGYADLCVDVCIPKIWLDSPSRKWAHDPEPYDEWAVNLDENAKTRLWFEVKSSIPSLGAVIRQIRRYQMGTGKKNWTIVSPDVRFQHLIRAQGIAFMCTGGKAF